MKFQQLEKNLKQNKISPVYLFTGDERYLMNTYIDKIKKQTTNPATESLNFLHLNNKDEKISEIFALAETVPVLSDKRIIVLDEEINLFNIKDEAELEIINNYLANPVDTTVLIILSQKVDKRKKIYKNLKKLGEIVEFKKLNLSEVSSWIGKIIRNNKNNISKSNINYLVERLHYLENEKTDLYALKNDLNNLLSYIKPGEEVTKEIIDTVIPQSIEDNVFKMMDLIVNGKLQGVYEMLEFFWEQGQSPISLFGLLLYQLRNILKIKLLLKDGYSQYEISQRAGLAPFIVRKTLPIARHYSLERLKQLYLEAGELDLNMKKGAIDPLFGLETYLLKLYKNK